MLEGGLLLEVGLVLGLGAEQLGGQPGQGFLGFVGVFLELGESQSALVEAVHELLLALKLLAYLEILLLEVSQLALKLGFQLLVLGQDHL
jgi:hypothetical protein